jgi:hypothetical protein
MGLWILRDNVVKCIESEAKYIRTVESDKYKNKTNENDDCEIGKSAQQ